MRNKRKNRLQAILELLSSNSIGSQDELLQMLALRGFMVTQATLSRDLKSLRTIKVATDLGGYRYVVPSASGHANVDDITENIPSTVQSGTHQAVMSMAISGNIVVLKTRTGYASGLAYDIDQLAAPFILGTIPGAADTVIAIVAEGTDRGEIFEYFRGFLPDDVIDAARDQFL